MTHTIKHVFDCTTKSSTAVPLTADEITAFDTRDAAWAAAAADRAKAKVLAQIATLEGQASMPRPVRDMLLASPVVNASAKVAITALEAQIAELRAQLV